MSCGAGANGENFDVGGSDFFSSVTLLTEASLKGEEVAEPCDGFLGRFVRFVLRVSVSETEPTCDS
jgi:hypothetical protein